MSSRSFFNKSQIRMFEGVNLGLIEQQVNEFMLTTARVYNVKHFAVALAQESLHYHYIMVSYE